MKKRMFVLAMVLVLSLLCSVSAFAAGTTEADYTGQSESQDVNITIDGQVVHVYLVDITFTPGTFTYSTGMKWDPDTYTYIPNGTPAWTGEGSVKITNHSDLPVNYTVESQNVVNTYGTLRIDVTGGTGTIEKCNVGDAPNSHNASATWKVSGTPTVSEISNQKLGEILVTISKTPVTP